MILAFRKRSLLQLKAAFLFVTLISTSSCSQGVPGQAEVQESDEWQTLFNGKDIDDWIVKIHHHEVGDNYANTFQVKDGVIQVNYDNYQEFNNRYGHLFYKEPYSSYHLTWEYRFTNQFLEDAPDYTYRNSGVMFHAQDPNTILKEQDWPI